MTTPAQPVTGSGSYIALPVETDPDTLAAEAIAYLAAQQPGWVAREGHLEVWMIRAFARIAAEVARVTAQVPLAIFQTFGTQLLGLPPLVGSSAQMNSTWNLTDTLGHTIPAGTMVAYRTSTATLAMFRVVADVVVAAGQSATAAGGVLLQAVNAGVAANGLAPSALALVDNLAWVASVASTTTSSGGADPEDQGAYLDRLAGDLQLLSPRPILPADFAALARNQPYVGRATAIDGYNPADGSGNNARMVAVAATDSAGNALASGNQATLAAYLQSLREVNFVVNVVSPTYSTVNISAQVTAIRGVSTATVNAACAAALSALLSPATWGGPPPAWTNLSVVRLLTVAAILAAVPGVSYVTGVQMSVGAGSLQPTDANLPGAVPLPIAGAINVAVTASP